MFSLLHHPYEQVSELGNFSLTSLLVENLGHQLLNKDTYKSGKNLPNLTLYKSKCNLSRKTIQEKLARVEPA